MRRRRPGRRSAALALLLASFTALLVPPTAGSAPPGAGPDVHVAGIRLDAPAGGPRTTPLPHLVRAGSDDRRGRTVRVAPGADATGPLAPVVLPPGAFDGVPDLAGVSPGDPTGALGITNHVGAVNVHMGTYDRAGTLLFPDPKRLRTLDPQLPLGAQDFDPKVVYDPYRDVFVIAFASATATKSFLSIVVIPEGTEADDTQTGWCTLHMLGDQVAGDGKQLADYPMLGFTSNRVTLTTNQFDFSTLLFKYVQVVSIRKSDLYDCAVDPVPIELFTRGKTRDPDGSRAFTIVPAIATGGDPTTQFMVSMDFDGTTGKLILWRLKPASGSLRLTRVEVSKGPMDFPPFGFQCGGTSQNTLWDTGDVRITSAFWDGALGRLYAATAIRGNVGGGAAESVVRWWEVDPAPTLANSDVPRKGTIGTSDTDAAWPSVTTDGDGQLWVNYARAGTGECLSAYVAVVQPGATADVSLLYRAGDARYEFEPGIERWGDYTAITRDPALGTTVAVYGAYPLDDGGGATSVWQQVIATLEDV